MSALFTISSHSPYDFPAQHKLSFDSKEDKYVNSVAYTDKCLGDFMISIKDEDWYPNTLFVIVADHSHNSPMNRRVAQREKFHIPMLWYGEALNIEFRGRKWDMVSSHIDITPTILSQLDIELENDYSGFDALNRNNIGFAPYSFIRGYGMVKKNSNYAYSINYNRALEENYSDSSAIIKNESEMFLQYSFQKYLNY